ncbi:alpha/beta hydrolase [Loktanella sp. D2R18]|uniref:alpha/beta hydrolase n=1 Tax=Rhodobacterales TaxID=204455 RepID=UPI000DEB7AC3|nr:MULTISPECIES: alpha/beta hydrolase [Rhodobacterales]MDO6590529.1 alpha/beta fold hydrolase [Yoonia sp. 1_MG-2023]RBW41305.1 alpha/beta hydrolase [Loktanella sp. D2R18]
MTDHIRVDAIEDLAVYRDGQKVALVTSRKARALLAYLLLTGQSQRREHLCEMFFDRTSDPRAGLRWSLSKLRKTLNDDAHERLIATKDSIKIDLTTIDLDAGFVREVHRNPRATTAHLRQAAELLSHKPLASLETSASADYDVWLLGVRNELQDLRGGIFQKLINADDFADHEALKWLRLWCRLEPYSHDAPYALWQKLIQLQRQYEASTVLTEYVDLMGPDANDWTKSAPTQPQLSGAAFKQRQSVEFCKAKDGVRIAYATVGSGPPLVKAANWLNHLELDWESPIWGDTFQALAANHTFIRYDERGNGLSDWEVPEISFPSFLNDLETVVDSQGLDRFPLLGMSQGCAVSIDYAVRHPGRVSALVLIGGYASGWRIGMSKEDQEQREAVLTLTRLGWGTSNPAYRHIFSQTFMPDADAERLAWFDDFQRQTTSPENAVRFQQAFGDIDVRHLLSQVQAPTLVIHARKDQRIPLDYGRELAVEIPNARLVTLESRSHIILGDEPAWKVCMDEIHDFLAENR